MTGVVAEGAGIGGRMRVLLITTTYPSSPEAVRDSIQRYARQTAESLVELGADVVVLASVADHGNQNGSQQVKVKRMWDLSADLGRAGRIFDLHYITFSQSIATWLAEAGEFDIIHTLCQLYAPQRIKNHARALISTFYHLEPYRQITDVLHLPVAHWLAVRTFMCSDAVVCFSENARDTLTSFIPTIDPPSLHVIPQGVDTERFRPRKDRTDPEGSPWNLLFVGSISWRKGVDLLLKSLQLLTKENCPVRMRLIGSGREKSRFLNMAQRLSIADRVQFTENVSESELIAAYQSADLFVLPTRLEGFGISLLEAMACAVPVICSNVNPVNQIVGDAGVTVSSWKPSSLATTVMNLLQDSSLRRRLGDAGRIRAVNHFSRTRTGELTIGLYNNLLG
jgi:glycosyltransferase involved in cell wall biosynthesis